MSAILEYVFQKRKQLSFFWSKLSKLHKKDPILHVTPGGGSHIDMVYVYVPAFWGTFSRNLV